MRKLSMMAAAAAVVGVGALASGTANAGMSVPPHTWQWTNHYSGYCQLSLESIEQDNPGQRLRVKVRNNSNTRLQFGLNIVVTKPDHRTFSLGANYDNVNAHESRQADTTSSLGTSLTPSTVVVTVTYCQERF